MLFVGMLVYEVLAIPSHVPLSSRILLYPFNGGLQLFELVPGGALVSNGDRQEALLLVGKVAGDGLVRSDRLSSTSSKGSLGLVGSRCVLGI